MSEFQADDDDALMVMMIMFGIHGIRGCSNILSFASIKPIVKSVKCVMQSERQDKVINSKSHIRAGSFARLCGKHILNDLFTLIIII